MPRRVSPEVEAEIVRLYPDRSLRVAQIATRLGLSREGVLKIAKRHGCPQRNPWGQPRRRDREELAARMVVLAERAEAREARGLRRRCGICGAITPEATCPRGHQL